MKRKVSERAKCAAQAAHFACALTIVTSCVVGAAGALAAVPVEESVAGERRPMEAVQQVATDPDGGAAATDVRRLSELFYQLQVLQQELQELRGTVEEQSHQLNRIARDQQEQYIDLDRRVAALRNNTSAPAISTTAQTPAASTATGGGTEREAYTAAFNLMKNRQFDESAYAFNKLIVDYPNGQFTPNAFYWLGELYLAKTEHEKARQSFAQVANLYPDHQKVPDALYKLGVVYHRLGDTQRSLEYLGKVRAEHPQSSAAGLAATYAAELR